MEKTKHITTAIQPLLFEKTGNLLPFNGEVQYLPQFFAPQQSDAFLQNLITTIAWKQEPIKIFGKPVLQPRLTAWYGNPGKSYSYSGITMQPLTWTDDLLQIKQRIETFAGIAFNSALLNYYRNGHDSMGWHRDNEKELGPNPTIASVSFGAARSFQLRNHADKSIIRTLQLTHGSLLLMRGQTQHYWQHRVPKTNTPTAARVNITFRVIV
jgi:alkylated DNA repair dioxygenase AlkB